MIITPFSGFYDRDVPFRQMFSIPLVTLSALFSEFFHLFLFHFLYIPVMEKESKFPRYASRRGWLASLIPLTPFIMVGMLCLLSASVLTSGVESC